VLDDITAIREMSQDERDQRTRSSSRPVPSM
jgi:hypothetical protein